MIEHERKRLHIAAAFVRIAGNIPYVVFILAAWLFGGNSEANESRGIEGLVYLAFIPLLVGHGLIRWWRFRFWIEDGEFRALDGVFIRREISIPFEKIRTVEVNEGLWQRLFGVVRLQVKTGATGTQADLTAISRAEAEHLQRSLRGAVQTAAGDDPAQPTEPEDDARQVVSLGELIAAGATSGRLGFLAVFAAWILNETADSTVKPLIDWASDFQADESARAILWALIATSVVVGVVLSVLGSIAATFLKYGKFSVRRRGDELTIQHGLLNRQTITLPLQRIQAIRFVQNPLREVLGVGTLLVEAIGHSEQKGRSSELYPFLGRDDLQAFIAEFIPEFRHEVRVERPPRRALIRFLLVPTLLSAVPGAILVGIYGGLALPAFALCPISMFVRYLKWKQTGIGTSDSMARLETRSLFSREIVVYPRRAVRSTGTAANFFQRRRDLSTAHITVASGAMGKTFTATNLDEVTADLLLGWLPGSPGVRPSPPAPIARQ